LGTTRNITKPGGGHHNTQVLNHNSFHNAPQQPAVRTTNVFIDTTKEGIMNLKQATKQPQPTFSKPQAHEQ
jgi:hypothetical protein